MKKQRYRWEKEKFIEAVKNSETISGVLQELGLFVSSGNYRTFYKYKNLWQVDTSHFIGYNSKNKTFNRERIPTEQILVENSFYSKCSLRKRIIKENIIEYKCAICGIISWLDNPLSLNLDHINGDNTDNRIENLRFLCPNCHTQTETYGGKNKVLKNVEKFGNNYYEDKRKILNRNTKINWPTIEELLKMVEEKPFITIAEELGVSDSAIRKRFKTHLGFIPKNKWSNNK